MTRPYNIRLANKFVRFFTMFVFLQSRSQLTSLRIINVRRQVIVNLNVQLQIIKINFDF